MVELSRGLGPDARGKVRVVAISVDPETDTWSGCAEYAKRMGVGENFWLLTGPLPEVFRIARKRFKVQVEENPPRRFPKPEKCCTARKLPWSTDGAGSVAPMAAQW
jgi:cytochrome oxidase Cu insertion factor (SCO1/SenC/PrrC family)